MLRHLAVPRTVPRRLDRAWCVQGKVAIGVGLSLTSTSHLAIYDDESSTGGKISNSVALTVVHGIE